MFDVSAGGGGGGGGVWLVGVVFLFLIMCKLLFHFFPFLSFRLSRWDHFAYRSYYIPMRGVVDGSLCEMYFDLSLESQTNIANSMERQVDEIKKKIEDQRQRAL